MKKIRNAGDDKNGNINRQNLCLNRDPLIQQKFLILSIKGEWKCLEFVNWISKTKDGWSSNLKVWIKQVIKKLSRSQVLLSKGNILKACSIWTLTKISQGEKFTNFGLKVFISLDFCFQVKRYDIEMSLLINQSFWLCKHIFIFLMTYHS